MTLNKKHNLNVMSQIDEAITALISATAEATAEEISSIFAKAVETLSAVTEQTWQREVESNVQAMINKLQAKIEVQSQKREKKYPPGCLSKR